MLSEFKLHCQENLKCSVIHTCQASSVDQIKPFFTVSSPLIPIIEQIQEAQQQLMFQRVSGLYQLFLESSRHITSSIPESIHFLVIYGWDAFNCCFLPDDRKTSLDKHF